MSHRITDLGDLERAVLELVWAHAPITAEEVQGKLSRPLRESTVRTVLTRLERKGFLTHATENRTFIYSATESRSAAAARAVKNVIDRFCNGSVEQALVGMVDAQILDRRELQRLAGKIAKAKRGDKP
ncbi:MAG TPA: BlaI/MecI/CopY family transcriptional regulator [Steroidobacteraceae bacterium]|nr:BlaI/MecI/CopY family transcriptional regulator [Steroidobacteraceae bacterium]